MDAVLGSGAGFRRRNRWRWARTKDAASRAAVPPGGVLVGLLALYACWGSSIPAMKLMVGGIPPLAGAGSVFFAGGVILLLLARRAPRPTRAQALRAASVGVLLLVGGQGVATVVLTRLTTSLTATLLATIPLWMAALRIGHRRQLDRGAVARLTAGFAGVLVVVLTAPAATIGGSGIALIGCVGAAVCWAGGSVLSAEPDALPNDSRFATSIELLTGGSVLLVIAAISGQLGPHTFAHAGASSLAALGYMVVVDSLAGFALYAWLLRTAPLQLVASYAYVTPLLAAVIGIAVFGEQPWPGMVVGAALIILAVYAEIRRRPRAC